MKILFIHGYPRKTGYTRYVCDLFTRGLQSGGAEIKHLDPAALAIKQCRGCYRCHLDLAGGCIHDDDMAPVLREIRTAEMLVCATPLYYYGMSALLKTFIERTYPLMRPGVAMDDDGMAHSCARYPEQWTGKAFAYIIVGAMWNPLEFEPLCKTFSYIVRATGLRDAGGIIRPESHLLPFNHIRPKMIARINSAVIRAGHELATRGYIPERIRSDVAAPITCDKQEFVEYSNLYWKYAEEMGARAAEPPQIAEAINTDIRILVKEMVKMADPAAMANLRAILQFDFPDEALNYRISINEGSCVLEETTSETCDLRITATSRAWNSLYTHTKPIKELLANGGIRLEGDKSLLRRLDSFFPRGNR